jgi:hypothetical protein
MLLDITLLPEDAGQHQTIMEASYDLRPGVPDMIGLSVVAVVAASGAGFSALAAWWWTTAMWLYMHV